MEAWPDLHVRGDAWVGEASKSLLDAPGDPLPARLSVDGAHVPLYYGHRLCDVDSLPTEESLRSRVLSAHGISAVWITLDAAGARAQYQPQSPEDPVFFLRRPGGSAAHLWRLFRTPRGGGSVHAGILRARPRGRGVGGILARGELGGAHRPVRHAPH